jgi:hypothetical protein
MLIVCQVVIVYQMILLTMYRVEMLKMYLPSGNVDFVPGGDYVPSENVDYVPSGMLIE